MFSVVYCCTGSKRLERTSLAQPDPRHDRVYCCRWFQYTDALKHWNSPSWKCTYRKWCLIFKKIVSSVFPGMAPLCLPESLHVQIKASLPKWQIWTIFVLFLLFMIFRVFVKDIQLINTEVSNFHPPQVFIISHILCISVPSDLAHPSNFFKKPLCIWANTF